MRLIPTFLICLSVAASAAPPPPPPEFVFDASKILIAAKPADAGSIAPLFADDVMVAVNGMIVARDKAAWLKWRDADNGDYDRGLVIGSSSGWGAGQEDVADLLVIDTFDPIGPTRLPKNYIADPRMQTRSTSYRFGSDHLIHRVMIAEVKAFFVPAR